MRKPFWFFSTIILLMGGVAWVGCSSNNSPVSPNAPTPTPLATATSTNSVQASATPSPTITSTPTITPTPTISPTATATTCSTYGTSSTGASVAPVSTGYYYADEIQALQATNMDSMVVVGSSSGASNDTYYAALYDANTGSQLFSSSFLSNSSTTAVTIAVSPAVNFPAGWYFMAVCVPTGSSNFNPMASNTDTGPIDEGAYAGGAPPANYSTLYAGSTNGVNTGSYYSLYFIACP